MRERERTVSDDDLAGLLGYRELAELLGVKQGTVRKYRSDGRLPKPDRTVLGRPFWYPGTIDAWRRKRPGQGRWGKRTS